MKNNNHIRGIAMRSNHDDIQEMLAIAKEVNRICDHLPCAGITLFRFYGYYLSRLPYADPAPRGI